jgi:hypothetical protein
VAAANAAAPLSQPGKRRAIASAGQLAQVLGADATAAGDQQPDQILLGVVLDP